MRFVLPARLVLVILLALTFSLSVDADLIRLKDGRKFNGRIIKDDGQTVEFEANISGIKAKFTFQHSDIATLTKSEKTSSGTSASKVASFRIGDYRVSPPESIDKTKEYFIEIPLNGVFGEDIFPDVIERLLRYADEEEDIKHIVFTIDSPGGIVGAADAIQDSIHKYRERFKFHLRVKQAISASIWIAFACDNVFIEDSGVIGGAVVYRMKSSGSAEVDAKLNSIVVSKLRSTARSNKHPDYLVAPMVQQKAQIYIWSEGDEIRHSLVRPKDVPAENMIVADTDKTVLTLTADQAVRIGWAKRDPGSSAKLGSVLGKADWVLYNNIGEAAINTISTHRETFQKLRERIDEANQMHPAATLRPGRDPVSRRAWRQATDRALLSYQKVAVELRKLRLLNRNLKAIELFSDHLDTQIARAEDEVNLVMQRLRQSRNY